MNLFKITFMHRTHENIVNVEMYHHKGIKEISEEILDAPDGAFWDQAENKRHMHKAILECLILENSKQGDN